ncbi:MAG: hypothetical protein OES15_05810 [Nitrosopumilus sp.]|nr:hypothetical protein [Nitrosopumilus sp.]MDH3780355.1 hypothetical protein [Nitrosopumilus sp.]MDH3853579.1 hypothetical protein [Nitrosopumilus sp.]
MNQSITLRKEKLYCKHCKENHTFEIPDNIDLLSPASDVFVRHLACPICHMIGEIRR